MKTTDILEESQRIHAAVVDDWKKPMTDIPSTLEEHFTAHEYDSIEHVFDKMYQMHTCDYEQFAKLIKEAYDIGLEEGIND